MTTEQRKPDYREPDYQDLEERQMLLRFAGKAMAALIASAPPDHILDNAKVAVWSFEAAEAMVAEFHRRKGGGQ